MGSDGLEIERKYLLRGAPSAEELAALGARPKRIEQVYLRPSGDWVRRVRRIEAHGQSRYVLTRKQDVEGIVRRELEADLSPEEYGQLISEADPERRVIRKVRHVIPHGPWTLELDVFSEPPGLVLLEVELRDPADVPDLPSAIAGLVVREVSEEPEYANYNLALRPVAAPPTPPSPALPLDAPAGPGHARDDGPAPT
jgi:CYTH domain-containing protein